MPSDLSLTQDSNGFFDIDFENGDFKLTDGLDTALYMSVLSEKRADENQVQFSRNRRGHFSNLFNRVPGYEVGSYLWVYTEQGVINQATLDNIRDTITNDGLSWMLEDGIVKSIEVEVTSEASLIKAQIGLIPLDEKDSRYYDLYFNTFTNVLPNTGNL